MSYQQLLEEICDSHKKPMGLEHAPLMIAISRICGDADAEIARLRADCERKNELLKRAKSFCVHEYHCAISEAGARHGCTCSVGGLDDLIDTELEPPHAT